jgi:hypothetical protein
MLKGHQPRVIYHRVYLSIRRKSSRSQASPPSTVGGGDLNTLRTVQGYLTYTKMHPPRTLRSAYAYGPRAVLLGGWAFLMGEVPL